MGAVPGCRDRVWPRLGAPVRRPIILITRRATPSVSATHSTTKLDREPDPMNGEEVGMSFVYPSAAGTHAARASREIFSHILEASGI